MYGVNMCSLFDFPAAEICSTNDLYICVLQSYIHLGE